MKDTDSMWRDMFKRYLEGVSYYEGVDFLSTVEWTPEEKKMINELLLELDEVHRL